jgi:hypothetical protein
LSCPILSCHVLSCLVLPRISRRIVPPLSGGDGDTIPNFCLFVFSLNT